MPITQNLFLQGICSMVGSIPHTVGGFVWTGLTSLGIWWSLLLAIGLILWIVFEFATRNAGIHYDSDNGFSPLFNIFVGSILNFAIQELLGLMLANMFGAVIYCISWPYILHFVVFVVTGFILRFTGFWTYLRILGEKPRQRRRQR